MKNCRVSGAFLPSIAVTAALFASAFVPIASAQTFNLSGTPPRITSISASSGPVGTRITIAGTGFSASNAISFGPGLIPLDTSVPQTATQISFTIPSTIILQCTITGQACPGGASFMTLTPAIYTLAVATDFTFSALSNSVSFTLTPTTVITSITPTPAVGKVGTIVTITGRGFSTNTNAINFDTSSQQGVIVQQGNSSSVITFAIPQYLFPRCAVTFPPCQQASFKPAAGTYSISVTPDFNYSQISNSFTFTLQSGTAATPTPVITSITPASGTIGTLVTINGTGFSPNLDIINFGGIGLALPHLSGTSLTFNIPQTVAPACTFFSDPPCQATTPITIVPGTYNISVATERTNVSNQVPLVVNSIPLPSTPPALATSTQTSEVQPTTGINVRSAPSINASIVGTETPSSTGDLVDGPVAANGYNWDEVAWEDGVLGWSADTYLTPVSQTICPIVAGDSVYIISGGQALTLYLRSNPSATAPVSAAEVAGTKGSVIGGPTIADNFTWWNLKFPDGTSGWATEADFVDATCVNTSTTAPPTGSLQAPVVAFVTPQNNATVSGQVTLTASVSSSVPVTGVDFYENNTLIGTAKSAPYALTWDASQLFNGSYTLKAVANTTANISGTASITVLVTGGLSIPIVTFVTPLNNAMIPSSTISVPLTVTVSATSPAVTSVDFYDGNTNTHIGSAATAPYTATWNPSQFAPGVHTLIAVAHTTPGGPTGSTSIRVNTGGTPPPPTSIQVTFVTPQAAAVVSGLVPLTVTVSSTAQISQVYFYADNTYLGAVTAPPYTVSWDTTQVLNGVHTLSAVAKDAKGDGGSASITVTVTGGLTTPVVTFVTPLSGATVSGQVPVTVNVAASSPAVTNVDFYDGSTLIGSAAAAPYTVTWNAGQVYNGAHTLLAIARTANTKISGSKSIAVNITGGLMPPSVSVNFISPQAGGTIFGQVPLLAAVSSSVPVAQVDFYQNGFLIGSASSSPYTVTWDSTQVVPGNYQLVATARTASGSVSKSISVAVIAPPIFHAGESIVVQTASKVGLNVRSGPSTNNSIIATESNGSTGTILINIPVVSGGYNWWQITYADGVTGWSVESYLAPGP